MLWVSETGWQVSSLRKGFTRFLSAAGIASLARAMLASKGRFVLEFHGTAGRRYPNIHRAVQPGLCREEFREVLHWLKGHFAFISPDEFLNSHRTGVLLTFDDGLSSNYANALPLLAEFNAPAIFFVSTQHIVDPKNWLPDSRKRAKKHWASGAEVPDSLAAEFFDGMSEDQLRACASHPLITIGSHTISHPRLTQCSSRQMEVELVSSRRWLTDITGQTVDLFAYPYGDYNRDVVEAVRSAGYRAAFAEDSLAVGVPWYEVPRVGIYDAGQAYLDVKLSGLHRRPAPLDWRDA